MNKQKLTATTAIQRASGFFLTEEIPSNVESMRDEDIFEFIEENRWDGVSSCLSPEQIYEMIKAYAAAEILKEKTNQNEHMLRRT